MQIMDKNINLGNKSIRNGIICSRRVSFYNVLLVLQFTLFHQI